MRCVLTNTSITFTNNSNIPAVPISWEWRINNDVVATTAECTHTFDTVGIYTIQVTASGSWGADVVYTEDIAALPDDTYPVITETTLPDMQENVAYGPVQLHATGGYGTYTWKGYDLPTGIVLSTSGELSGTPTDGSNLTPMIVVTDAATRTGARVYTITYTV